MKTDQELLPSREQRRRASLIPAIAAVGLNLHRLHELPWASNSSFIKLDDFVTPTV